MDVSVGQYSMPMKQVDWLGASWDGFLFYLQTQLESATVSRFPQSFSDNSFL